MTLSVSRYFIPFGENCQLGAALDFYGYKESSLFKWANISSDKLFKALKNNFREIYDAQFADVFFRPPNGRAGIIGGGAKNCTSSKRWLGFLRRLYGSSGSV